MSVAWRSPRRWGGLLALGLALYFLFLLATLPASWVAWGIGRLSSGAVSLQQAAGTLWHGSSALVVPRAGPSAMGRLHWSVNPLWLFVGRGQAQLRLVDSNTDSQAIVIIAYRQLAVREVNADFPARLVALVHSPVSLFAPTGRVRVTARALTLNLHGIHGDAEFIWEGAGGRATEAVWFGDYRLALTGRGKIAELTITTLRGDLEVTAQGQWWVTGNGRFQLMGSAVPKARHAELEPLLRLMGSDQGGGRRSLHFVTHLPLGRLVGFTS